MEATNNQPKILRILAMCAAAAERAGDLMREIAFEHDTNFDHVEESFDLHADAKQVSDKCIFASLLHHFPDLKFRQPIPDTATNEVPREWIVREPTQEILNIQCPSDYLELSFDDIVLWINSLEGKEEFNKSHLDQVSILIGLTVKGKAVAGVIHQPYYNYLVYDSDTETGRTIWGLFGYGVGGCQPNSPPADTLIVVTTQCNNNNNNNNNSNNNNTVEGAVILALQPNTVLRVGGIGYKILLLVEGKVHAFVLEKTFEKWDTCAGEAILKAVGGKLTDVHGNWYDYSANARLASKNGVLATAKGVDHDNLVSKIPADIKKLLKY